MQYLCCISRVLGVYTSILCVPLTALPSQYERRKHLATSPSLRASLVRLLCTRDAPSELRVLALECLCTATAAEGSMKVRASFLFHHCVWVLAQVCMCASVLVFSCGWSLCIELTTYSS